MRFPRGLVGHAYPWDVIGDPGFAGRVRDRGIGEVALAAAYHAVRGATPLHPRHRIVEMPAALHLRLRADRWAGHEIVPEEATGLFAAAAAELGAASIPVTPWTVLTHRDGAGRAHPDHVVRNAFGDAYGYALCPASPAVREYTLTLAAESFEATTSGRTVLESLEGMGMAHAGAHDKLGGAGWGPADAELLSLCFCEHCRRGYGAAGADADEIARWVRAGVGSGRSAADVLGTAAPLVARHRAAVVDELGRAVALAARSAGVEVAILTDEGEPFTTAEPTSPVRDLEEVVPCWDAIDRSADRVRAAAERSERVAVYLTILDDPSWQALRDRLFALSDAGATRVHLYHLGLASATASAAFDRAWEAAR